MAYEWSDDEYARLHKDIRAGRALLQKWYEAIEDGRAAKWMPDPRYPINIPPDTCDAVIAHIDREYEKELRAWGFLEAAGSYTHGPEFSRLKPPQRLALCQELRTLLKGNPYPCPQCKRAKSDCECEKVE